ncbi:uncharacterized protein QYS62_008157 [Fusarium acuminatum]|uniref:Uncharacterized protein n=1 Tax=Fusarium acuminatum TaxID=5515 RepID=A0ABZ2X5A1_9HYPO
MEIRFKLAETHQPQKRPQFENKPSSLAFVHVNNPAQAKDKTTQRKVRRHVMKDIGRSRRLGAIQLETTATPKNNSVSIPVYWGDVKVCVNFRRLFWAMDMVSEGLLSIAVIDPSRKLQKRLAEGLGDLQTFDEIEQYTESVSLVRKAIRPESQACQNAVIGTVICLAVFDMRVGKSDSWMMHMAGLERIVELAGGVEVLDSRPAIRQSLFIADVLGSVLEDARPRFPLPGSTFALPRVSRSRYVQRLLASLRDSEPHSKTPSAIIDSSLQLASQLAALLTDVCQNSRIKLDLLIPSCTVAHQVLSLPRMDYSTTDRGTDSSWPISGVAELIRLSALSLFAIVVTQTSGEAIYVASRRKAPVKLLLTQISDNVWTGRQELKLWVLVIHSCIEMGSSRLWLVDQVVQVMSLLRLRSWSDLMSCLRRVVWIEKIALSDMEQLRSDVENSLKHL